MDTKFFLAVFNFALFAFALWYLLRKPLVVFFAERASDLGARLEEITKKSREVRNQFKQTEKKIEQISFEIETLNKEMEEEGELEKKRIVEQSKQYAVNLSQDTQVTANQELIKAKNQLQQQAMRKSIDVAKRLLQEKVTQDDQEQLFSYFITELGKNRDERTSAG